jgi:hypothetical protein
VLGKDLIIIDQTFFWQSDENKRKYRLSNWSIICRPKDQGGLGIEVLELKNKCLLSKWLFKLLSQEGMWQQLLHNKYLHSIAEAEARPTDSPFWKGILKVKQDFFSIGVFKVGDGSSVRFWEDVWLGDMPLAAQFPFLFNIVRHKNVLVSTVLAQTPINITFRRGLNEHKYNEWLNMCHKLMNVNLTTEQDKFV